MTIMVEEGTVRADARRPADSPESARRSRRRAGRPAQRAARRREASVGYLFVAPAVALMAVMGIFPVGYAMVLSFFRWNGLSPRWSWVGLENFADLLWADPVIAPQIHNAAVNTGLSMLVVPAAVVLISFPLAVLLNSVRRIRTLLRTIYFLPYVANGIAIVYTWRLIYDPKGLVNGTLDLLGLDGLIQEHGYLGTPDTALVAVLIVIVWMSAPIGILLYLTGLQSIDQDLFDAASIDGAGRLRTLTAITWPLLLPTTGLLVVLAIQGVLHGFGPFLLLTNGGPIGRTDVLALEVYNLAFGVYSKNLGYSSALGWMLAAVGIGFAIANMRLMRSRR